jgi:hypothetical protein
MFILYMASEWIQNVMRLLAPVLQSLGCSFAQKMFNSCFPSTQGCTTYDVCNPTQTVPYFQLSLLLRLLSLGFFSSLSHMMMDALSLVTFPCWKSPLSAAWPNMTGVIPHNDDDSKVDMTLKRKGSISHRRWLLCNVEIMNPLIAQWNRKTLKDAIVSWCLNW